MDSTLLAENRSVSACDDPRELRKTYRPNDDTRRPDCLAGLGGFELRNVGANIPLKGRTDFRESDRILATETIRV
jgi:hypothetical protein